MSRIDVHGILASPSHAQWERHIMSQTYPCATPLAEPGRRNAVILMVENAGIAAIGDA